MNYFKKTAFTGFGILALSAIAMTPANTASAQNAQPSTQAASQEISDAKLQAYIVSASKVQSIQNKTMPQLSQAQSQEQADSIKENAQTEMISAIQSTENITVNEFQMIAQQIRNDDQLAQRINKLAKSMMN